MLIYLFAVACVLLAYVLFRNRNEHESNVPMVSYCLPLVGHALWFKMNMLGFLESCRAKYGNVFKIKIFNVTMVVICDKSLSKDFFKKQEAQMSLFEVLKRLYFDYAFSDDPSTFERNIKLIKKSITVNVEEFMPKIYEEASKMIDNIKSGILSKQAIKFVTRTSARCFLDIDLSDSLFNDIMLFTDQLNQIVVTTYMLPKWFIKWIFGYKLRATRKRITNSMIPILENYRVNGGACSLIQNCLAEKLTNQDIADVIITLLYVSSENTALGLTASITDIYNNRQFLKKIQVDVAKNINDYKNLLKLESLDNAVMESARLNIHVFSLNRQPIAEKYIGTCCVGDADSVVLCGQMVHDAI